MTIFINKLICINAAELTAFNKWQLQNALFGHFGFRSARSWLKPFLRFTTSHFASPGLASQTLIWAGKMSVT